MQWQSCILHIPASRNGVQNTLELQIAQVLQRSGKHQEALLALQAVAAAAPTTPGLLSRLQAAAALTLQSRKRGSPAAMHEVTELVTAVFASAGDMLLVFSSCHWSLSVLITSGCMPLSQR